MEHQNSLKEKNEQLSIEQLSIGLLKQLVEFKSQLDKIGVMLRDIVPQETNIKIVSQDGNLVLTNTDTKETIHLKDWLPDGYSFTPHQKFTHLWKEKKVGFQEEDLSYRGFLLSLFHEIGHSKAPHIRPCTYTQTVKALFQSLKKFLKNLTLSKKTVSEGENIKTQYSLHSLESWEVLPEWYVEIISKFDAKSERDAWAYALKELRKLERDGFEVFAWFDSVAEIQAYIEYCLYTYDVDYYTKSLFRGVQNRKNQAVFSKHKERIFNVLRKK